MIIGQFVPDDFTSQAPKWQLTVLRPNVSLALQFDGNESSALDYALTFEPIGYVGYVGQDYDKWWGVSAMVTMTSNNGIGYGGMFRWKNYNIGLAHHSGPEDTLLYVSVDLYKFILGKDGRTNQADKFLGDVKKKFVTKAREAAGDDQGGGE